MKLKSIAVKLKKKKKIHKSKLTHFWTTSESKNTSETSKCLHTNENKSTIYTDLWDAVVRKKFTTVNNDIKIEEISQINNLTLYFKEEL